MCANLRPFKKYVDPKSLVTMLAVKKSANVTPEVNLRNPLTSTSGHEAHKQAQVFKPRAYITRRSKQRYQWPQIKNYVLQKIKKEATYLICKD